MPPKPKDRLQVTAFHAIYRKLRRADPQFRKSREEDFVTAILATSDHAFRKADKKLAQQWINTYGSKKDRKEEFTEE